MKEELSILYPVTAVVLCIAIFAAYVLCHTDRRYRLKLVLVPATIGAAVFSFVFFGAKLGYAYPAGLPETFEYIAHKVILIESEKRYIDVLVVSRKPLERDARLHRAPWSQKLEDAMKGAQAMKRGGGSVEMEQQGKPQGDEYPEWVPKRVLPQEQIPKSPIPDQPALPELPPANPMYTT